MNKVIALVVIAFLMCSAGCGTVSQASSKEGPAIYGGLRFDCEMMSSNRTEAGVLLLMLLDMPFCLALDTVLLPVSIPNEIIEGGIDVRVGLNGWGN